MKGNRQTKGYKIVYVCCWVHVNMLLLRKTNWKWITSRCFHFNEHMKQDVICSLTQFHLKNMVFQIQISHYAIISHLILFSIGITCKIRCPFVDNSNWFYGKMKVFSVSYSVLATLSDKNMTSLNYNIFALDWISLVYVWFPALWCCPVLIDSSTYIFCSFCWFKLT